MANPTIVSATQNNATVGSGLTSVTVSSTGSATAGNLAIATLLLNTGTTNPTITTPAGWSVLLAATQTASGGSFWLAIYYRIIPTTGALSQTFSWATSTAAAGGEWSFEEWSGVNNATPIDGSAATTLNVSGTSPTSPSVTPTISNDTLICVLADDATASQAVTVTIPTGMTSVLNVSGSSTQDAFGVASLALSSTAATGTKTWTLSKAHAAIGVSFLLNGAPNPIVQFVGQPPAYLFTPGKGPIKGLRPTQAFPPAIVVPPEGIPAPGSLVTPGPLFAPVTGPPRGLRPTQGFPPATVTPPEGIPPGTIFSPGRWGPSHGLTPTQAFPPAIVAVTFVQLSGSVTSVSSARAGASFSAALSGRATSQAKAQAAGTFNLALSGRVTQQAKESAGFSGKVPLSAQLIEQAKASAAFSGTVPLTGRAASQAKAQAAGTFALTLKATLLVEAKASAAVSGTVPLTGQVQSQAKNRAQPSGTVPLSGLVTSQAKEQGQVTALIPLSGRLQSQAKASASGAFAASLSGRIGQQAKAFAGFSGTVGLSATFVGQAKASGTVLALLQLSGLITEQSKASAAPTGQAALRGRVLSTSTAQSQFSGFVSLSGEVQAASFMQGSVLPILFLTATCTSQSSSSLAPLTLVQSGPPVLPPAGGGKKKWFEKSVRPIWDVQREKDLNAASAQALPVILPKQQETGGLGPTPITPAPVTSVTPGVGQSGPWHSILPPAPQPTQKKEQLSGRPRPPRHSDLRIVEHDDTAFAQTTSQAAGGASLAEQDDRSSSAAEARAGAGASLAEQDDSHQAASHALANAAVARAEDNESGSAHGWGDLTDDELIALLF